MSKKDKKETQNLSKSKAKREERRKELAAEKKKKLIWRIVGIVIAVAIVAAIAIYVGKKVYVVAIRTTPNSDFSVGLEDNGIISNVNVSDYVTVVDYKNIDIPADEVAATDEEVDEDITSTLESYDYVSDDSSLTVADGDVVNIDYVGTIDDEEFDGGNSEGEGYDLTIGSGTFIDDFEDQLIGTHPGDEVSVEVTFPDDYSNSDLAGKDAVFAVTINGITVTPELTDEFVAENLDIEGVTTADEYRAYVENTYYEDHLEEYLTNYVYDNSTVKSYPKSYLKNIKSILKYNDEYTMSYYNSMFESYGMTGYGYDSLWAYAGVDDEVGYEKDLTSRAQDTVKTALVYQYIYENEGLSIDVDEMLSEMTEENGDDYTDSMLETYGQGYMAQSEIKTAVINYLMELYK